MIVFDLRCAPAGHVFEAWFGSSADYDDQRARGLVACPLCGALAVEKAPMAPAVPRGGGDVAAPAPAEIKRKLAELAVLQRKMIAGSDWVGDRFASEARAIHLGESDARAIHGRATLADARDLAADGVPVAPLPFPVAPPGEEN